MTPAGGRPPAAAPPAVSAPANRQCAPSPDPGRRRQGRARSGPAPDPRSGEMPLRSCPALSVSHLARAPVRRFPSARPLADASDRVAGYTAGYSTCKDFNMKPFAAALFTLLVLTGCGQKGPLYLPEDTAATSAVQTETTEQSTEK
ncbi:MAG: hypothetical protein CMK82_02455 [Pseudomonadales bacterium]|nr:hypothetical protein [Pseudomonadales bacterium]MAS65673.1 hypothetical protein [Pseudomonadales bacterium]